MPNNKGFALITGSCGGIGKELVHAFHKDGYKVIATDRAVLPEDLAADYFIQQDIELSVRDEKQAESVFSHIQSILNGNGLKVLINNAAMQILGSSESLTREDWQTTLNVNLLAPFFWAQALLPALISAEGCIVNVSSIHARLTKPNFVAYATSKAALSGLTRAMAVDLGDRVRVNAIEPAAIATPMLKKGFSGKEDMFHLLEKCHPMLRIGTAREVAQLALALCDGSLEFMHGACITLDGGIGARLFDPE